MRVAYQAGVVRALLESGLTFAHADGSSGGTMNLAMLLSGIAPEEMCARWRALDVHRFFSPQPAREYLRLLDAPAFGDADGIVQHVFPQLGIDIDRIRSAAGIRGSFNVCDFASKTLVGVPHDRITLNLLVASVSLPILMPAVMDGGRAFTDAVWIKDANLIDTVKRGARELWLVWCIGNTPQYRDGVVNQYVHMIEMSAHGALFEEFDRIREINQRIAGGEAVYGHTQPIRLHLIRPRYPLPLDPEFYLGGIDAATLIDMGYADAWRYLDTMTAEGLPLQPEITQMEPSPPALSFRESMSGYFALGATDPEQGRALGEAAGTRLTLHGAITIRDTDRFIADPQHLGEMAARIDFPPLGESISAKRATFNFFSPTDRSELLKLMVYELAFAVASQDYYLAGRKEVRNDPGIDLWSDTTTLKVRLHEGSDANGRVVGAGVLTLGVPELLALSASMRVRDAPSPLAAAKVVAAFGGFFMGALWHLYAPRWSKPQGLRQRLLRWLGRR